jgi:hypothetical protein
MSRPLGKLHLSTRSDTATTRARSPDAGIARGPGLVAAGVTAAIVFVIGHQLFPIKPRPAPTPPPIATADAGAPGAMAAAVDATAAVTPPAADAGAAATNIADAGAAAVAIADAGRRPPTAEKEPAPEPVKPADEPAAEEGPAAGAPLSKAEKQRQADKDLAREAWRRNRPDISVAGSKTSILVPIKGSIKGADFKILRKSRTVVVTLPKAVSMVTMRVYNLKHPSFKKLWIDQDEANAQPADGTKLRLILSQTLDPQVEITDDFVRVTIRRPEPADAPAERAEKRSEPADEAAAPEKEKD